MVRSFRAGRWGLPVNNPPGEDRRRTGVSPQSGPEMGRKAKGLTLKWKAERTDAEKCHPKGAEKYRIAVGTGTGMTAEMRETGWFIFCRQRAQESAKTEKVRRVGRDRFPGGWSKNKGLWRKGLGGSGKEKKSAFAAQVGHVYAVNADTVWVKENRRCENVDIGMGLANNQRRLL